MSTLPPVPALTPEETAHLRLLSIFHYVVGGLIALFSLFPLIHVALGIGMITGALPMHDANGDSSAEDARLAGWIFIGIGSVIILCGVTLGAFIAYAGRCLAQQRRHTLCMVVAALSCLCMPLGTVLGVFTLIVLLRPSVKAAFDAPAPLQS
jgi:hypothetical protein